MDDFKALLANRQAVKRIKPPAYRWQDLALKIIKELNIPDFKRSAVFKVCRDYPSNQVEAALIDTKELCKTGNAWAYFFKVVDGFAEGADGKKSIVK